MKNSTELIVCILLCFNFFACKTSKKASENVLIINPTNFVIEKLICKNLSENVSTLSTQNDEILIVSYFLKNDSLVYEKWNSSIFNIQDENSIVNINKTLPIPTIADCRLKLFLIEMDTERSESEMVDLLTASVNLSEMQVKDAILDDDLLGVFDLTFNQKPLRKNRAIRFWGMHLFDEFEYVVECSVN